MTHKFVHLLVPTPYGVSEVLIIAALVYLLAMIIIMHFTSQFAMSKKGHATMGLVTRINVSFVEFYEFFIKLLRKTEKEVDILLRFV